MIRNAKGWRPADDTPARLQLTSLVDMMVILVVFLLMSFSVEGQLVTPAEGLELSPSQSEIPVVAGLVLEVGLQQVRLAGQVLLDAETLAQPDMSALDPLRLALKQWPQPVGENPVLMQVDRRVPYSFLSRILAVCSETGWQNLSLVVLGAGS